MTSQEFVNKWRQSTLKESAGSQSHFNDLCYVLGHPTPAQADPEGTHFTFEHGANKRTGGQGWADVWKRGYFAWEYKGKHKNLVAAYEQLQLYRDALLNPPLLIVSDMETIVIYTNFTNTVKQTFTLTFDDLLTREGLNTLRNAFEHPDRLRSDQTAEGVTKQAAIQFGKLAESLRKAGHSPEKAAHFLIRILFCLFAEDIGLLPDNLFTKLIDNTKDDPKRFHELLGELFNHMADGGFFGLERIPHFNGGIFDSAEALPLDRDSLGILSQGAQLDWSSIEPSIFGTLFERGLDPGKRTQLGAHYTSRDDILLIVEPVLMRPLRRRWEEVRHQAQELHNKWQATSSTTGTKTRLRKRLERLLYGFADEISNTKVLDPACGSGNFLYVALRQLLDLEKDVIAFGMSLGFPLRLPMTDPKNLFGIEINEYAHELAQATIWIGYIQWLRENGFGQPSEPILKALDNIHQMDAILAFDSEGAPIEPEWPEADVIIGNPPFLGDKKMRSELGDQYTNVLRLLFRERLPGGVDLCCYWFEKARALIESGKLKRAGLLATQGIRGGANRKTLERIRESGNIFWAESDRPWILDGANVHVSMAGFDNGEESSCVLDGISVAAINVDLTTATDVASSRRLISNRNLSFLGSCKGGPFDIDFEEAAGMLVSPDNPHAMPNSDVIRPVVNSRDLLSTHTTRWIVDSADHELDAFANYEKPFLIVVTRVKPKRDANRNRWLMENWWRPQRMRPAMRSAIAPLDRFIITPTTAKHRVFAWLKPPVLPDHQLIVFAREDDYFFGVLHSKIHELWALRQGTQLEDRPRYTPTTCFETFPFPWPPGEEPVHDPIVHAIAAAAVDLVEKRDRWLNPPEWTQTETLEFSGTVGGPWDSLIDPSTIVDQKAAKIGTVEYPRIVPADEACAKRLKQRTLTNLYNQRPTWLDLAHQRLDLAVLDAYAWPHDLAEDQILESLLALNLERVA